MATTTQNLGLIKPDGTDKIRIAQINSNMDTLDTKIGPVGSTPLQTQATNAAASISTLQSSTAIIVDGDTAGAAVAPGQYAYIKNNTHGLAEGLYKNKSSSAFPVGGGTADSTVFEAVPGGLGSEVASLINSNLLWKLAPDYATAYANAKTEIMLVGKGKAYSDTYNDTYIALSIIIPKMSIDSINRFWQVGDNYNGASYFHLQAQVSLSGASYVGLFKDANFIDEGSYEWYYR